MNDHLDSLIRGSLDHHAPAEPPDTDLADRVAALGHRRRATQRTGLAALAVVAVAGAAWGITSLPPTGPVVATAPTPPPSPATGTPTPQASPTRAGAQKDVSAFPENHFASPTGNLLCSITQGGDLGVPRVFCGLPATFTADIPAADDVCEPTDVPVAGIQLTAEGPARWACAGDRQVFPYLDASGSSPVGAHATAWWDPTFGSTLVEPNQGQHTDEADEVILAVLPYDRALVAGDLTCAMATDGVSCTNTATGHGFHLNRSGAELR